MSSQVREDRVMDWTWTWRDTFGTAWFIIVILLVLMPARYDPAIILMRWLRDRRVREMDGGMEKRVHDGTGGTIDPNDRDGTLVSETPAGRLWAIIARNECPDCGKSGFYEGPQGGLSINIECAHCGHWFNVTPVIGIAERIDK